MKTILERVSFGKLASHPAGTGAMRDNRRDSAQVCDRIWLPAVYESAATATRAVTQRPDECRSPRLAAFPDVS